MRDTATGDQLLGLGEELDLADTAASELYVVTRDSDRTETPVRLYLAFDGVDIEDGGVVEVFAPDERRDLLEKGPPGIEVTRHRACLDHRRALPVLAIGLVIVERQFQRNGERHGTRIGP